AIIAHDSSRLSNDCRPANGLDLADAAFVFGFQRTGPGTIQYGGARRAFCKRAASAHHVRSSAKRAKLRSSDLPAASRGWPWSSRVFAIGPTSTVLEITTMPISDRVPCQAAFARAPPRRPAE